MHLINKETLFFLEAILLLIKQKKRSKCLVLRPGSQKNLSVIEPHTTDTF